MSQYYIHANLVEICQPAHQIWCTQALFGLNLAVLSPAVTLKIRSRLPKPNQLVIMSQCYTYANLVKIHSPVHAISCKQKSVMPTHPKQYAPLPFGGGHNETEHSFRRQKVSRLPRMLSSVLPWISPCVLLKQKWHHQILRYKYVLFVCLPVCVLTCAQVDLRYCINLCNAMIIRLCLIYVIDYSWLRLQIMITPGLLTRQQKKKKKKETATTKNTNAVFNTNRNFCRKQTLRVDKQINKQKWRPMPWQSVELLW